MSPVTVDKAVCKPREGDLLSHTAHAEDNKYASVAGSEYNRYKKLSMRKEWRRWSNMVLGGGGRVGCCKKSRHRES